MEECARKLRRSGYPATVRHQMVKEALTKYDKMCKVEEEGGRPVNRAREWQQSARRIRSEKEGNKKKEFRKKSRKSEKVGNQKK